MEKINLSRLKNCMARAQRGEELTIGFLGGSITQGSLATEHENTYAYRVFTWWKETLSKWEISLCKWRDRRNNFSLWSFQSCYGCADVSAGFRSGGFQCE